MEYTIKKGFDRNKKDYDDFAKLLGEQMTDTRVKAALKIATTWETTGTAPEQPDTATMLDLMETNEADEQKVLEHCNLVWSDADNSHTAKLFARMATKPTSDNELTDFRNKFRLKHVMLGKMLWNSLTSRF